MPPNRIIFLGTPTAVWWDLREGLVPGMRVSRQVMVTVSQMILRVRLTWIQEPSVIEAAPGSIACKEDDGTGRIVVSNVIKVRAFLLGEGHVIRIGNEGERVPVAGQR